MKKTTIYIPEEEMALLDARARKEKRPKAGLIREALALYLANEDQKLPAWIGMIDEPNSDLKAANAEDWLEANWKPEIAQRRKPRPPSSGIFEDDEVDSSNLDDWLREQWRPA